MVAQKFYESPDIVAASAPADAFSTAYRIMEVASEVAGSGSSPVQGRLWPWLVLKFLGYIEIGKARRRQDERMGGER